MSFGSEYIVIFNLCEFSEGPMHSLCEMSGPESCESSCMTEVFWMVTFDNHDKVLGPALT